MKVILLTLFLVLIASSSALGISKRSGQQTSIHSLHLEKISSLGSAIKGLIQLADNDEVGPVVEVIQEILNEFNEGLNYKLAQSESLYYYGTYLIQQAQLYVAMLEERIAQLDSMLQSAQQGQAELQNAIDGNVQAIQDANSAVDLETQRRQDAHNAYEEHASNVRDAIQALRGAQETLQQLRDEDLAAGSSFLQMKTKKFAKSLIEVEKKLSKTKLKLSTTDLYIKQLVLIAQDVEVSASVNADTFDQIFNLLAIFEQSLEDELQKAADQDQEQSDASQQILANLRETIAAQQDQLASNQAQFNQLGEDISGFQSSLAEDQTALEQGRAQLAEFQAQFDEQVRIIEGQISRLQVDIDVLQRALVFVQTESGYVAPAVDDQSGDVPIAEVERNPIVYEPADLPSGNNADGGDLQAQEPSGLSIAPEPVPAPVIPEPQLDPNYEPSSTSVYAPLPGPGLVPESPIPQRNPDYVPAAQELQESSEEEPENANAADVIYGQDEQESSEEEEAQVSAQAYADAQVAEESSEEEEAQASAEAYADAQLADE